MSRRRARRVSLVTAQVFAETLENRSLLSAVNGFANADGDQSMQLQRESDVQRPDNREVFEHLDVNMDGRLVSSEVSEAGWQRISRADLNQDDAVTLQELTSFREINEREARTSDPERAFHRLDADENGRLTESEVRPALWAHIQHADQNADGVSFQELEDARDADEEGLQRPSPQEAFARLDTDTDGRITESEVSAHVWTEISEADGNGDGRISLDELLNHRLESERDVERPEPGQVFDRLDVNADGRLTSDEVSEVAWARISERADTNSDGAVTYEELREARRQLEFGVRLPDPGDRFAQLDTNQNGKIEENEVTPEGWDRLSQADGNLDGGVTSAELRLARESDEVAVRGPEPDDPFRRLDANDDGAITPDEVSPELWNQRLRAADTDGSGSVTLDEIHALSFRRFDSNDDGFITSDEVEPGVWRHLRRSDANNDDRISPTEMADGRRQEEREVRKPNPGAVFGELDENNDGLLTEDEVSGHLWRHLSRADANQDDSVSQQELEAARQNQEGEVESDRPDEPFRLLDANEDGLLTADEVSPAVWTRISNADANGDLAISLAELRDHRRRMEADAERPTGDSDFDELDANDDGVLTADEVSERAWHRLQRADSNNDQAVSRAEIAALRQIAEQNLEGHRPTREAFGHLDVNSDGQLTQDEVSDQTWQRISVADANNDGGVTRQELHDARQTHEDHVGRPGDNGSFGELDTNNDGALTSAEVSEQLWDRIAAADADGDGGVTAEELAAFRAEAESEIDRPAPRDFFRRLDANRDQELTADEVSPQMWAVISQADANQDNAVSLQEMREHRREREQDTRRPSPADVFARLDANQDGQLTPDEVTPEAWERLSLIDANNDGGVTLEELRAFRAAREDETQRPQPESAFDRLDVNEDGQLTADEVSTQVWERLSQADANDDSAVTKFELRQHREQNEEDTQRPDPAAAFGRLDIDGNGQLTEDEVTAAVWAEIADADADGNGGVTIGEFLLQRDANEDEVRRPHPEAHFDELDVNNDGALTIDEVRPAAWDQLSAADANQDGRITMQELRDHRNNNESDAQRPTPAGAFERLDLNNDGALTADEVNDEVWARISQADGNSDGRVTLDELRDFREENEDMVRRPNLNQAFARLDVNEDGFLTVDEVNAEIWSHLLAADANDDGQVSLEELRSQREHEEADAQRPQPEGAFSQLDLNGDSRLTADEISDTVWERVSTADTNEDGAVTITELREARDRNERRAERPEPGEVFDQLDVNNDGALTSDEVRLPTFEHLSRADANNDGAVTQEELRAAHNDARRQIRWEANASAATYEVWINDAETNELVLREDRLSATELSVLNLEDGVYDAWIQDENADGSGTWRTRQQITVQNGELAVAQSVGDITWQSFGNAVTYEVWIAQDGQRVDRVTGLTSTTYSLPGLADGTYSYWIQAEGENGRGPWSAGMTFEVSNGALVVVPSPGTLTWTADAGAASYEVWINAAGTRDRVGGARGLADPQFDLPALEDGAYDYWIQFEDADGGGSWSEKRTFLVQNGQLTEAAPVGSVSWQIDAAAVSYEIWVSDASTGQRVLRETSITANTFEVPYVADGTYYYWIQNEGADGRGPWSSRRSFVVADGEIRTSAGTLSWPSDAGATTYEIWISDAGGTSRPVYRRRGLETTSVQLPPLADGTYDYWIQAEDESGAGSWSSLLNFTVLNGQVV